jgi:hypothetical protein
MTYKDIIENDHERFIKTFLKAVKLRYSKVQAYGLSYKDLGLAGIMAKINDKVARIRNIMAQNAVEGQESLQDNLLDISNYAIMGMMVLDEEFQQFKESLGEKRDFRPLSELMREVFDNDHD